MASSWLRLRMRYLGSMRISRVALAVGLLAAAIVVYRWLRAPLPGVVRYKDVPVVHQMARQEIDDYIFALQDTRPPECRIAYHGPSSDRRPTVSILVDFHDDEFYNLKLTLASILKHTPDRLYGEIVVLDDGSDQSAIKRHAAEVLNGEAFAKVKAFRSEQHHGRGMTRFKASQVAEGAVLVFVSSDVTVNVGWLEPLIDAVAEDRRRLVVSHSDNFLSERRFYQVDDRLVSTFSWTLSTVYTESESSDGAKYVRMPVMRGEVLAVARDYLEAVGNYDDGMAVGGGHDLELSLRTWLCGGEVLMSICSRVATHSVLKPLVVSNQTNYRRIVELWLGDYKDVAYRQGMVSGQLTADERLDVNIRRSFLDKRLTCRNMDWYLDNVATHVLAPPPEMLYYGKLKVSYTYCARATKEQGPEVILVLCRPYLYDPSMTFMLDKSNRIRMGDTCFMASSATSRIVLSACQEENKLQTWDYLESGYIVSRAFDDACLTHVTSMDDPKTRRHHIHVSPCKSSDEHKQLWSFINF